MSLVADYTTEASNTEGSSSEDGQEDEATQPAANVVISNTEKLPGANIVLGTTSKATGMVFSNPFLETEIAKTASLEKHVKMVTNDAYLLQKNGRKICWNFRKGRCRFGTNCQYAHDSDLNEIDMDKINTTATATTGKGKNMIKPLLRSGKRIRAGLSDAIEPSKRVMKTYYKQDQTH